MQHDIIPVVPQTTVNLNYLDELVLRGGKGPVKWHTRCSRYHGSRENCDLVKAEFVSKAGNKTPCYRHSAARKQAQPKTKARKT